MSKPSAYYNEIDPYAAQWLRNLIGAGLIAPGDVDTRSIAEVKPDDVAGYTQCHWFAGIAGWSLALRMAGWGDDRPIWTASCPCQPFSLAGKQEGFEDERDLWPVLRPLIRECRPSVVMGEQVASAAQWLSRVRGDLEEMDYAMGAMPIQAAGAGAAQLRDRFWFVASSNQGVRGRRPDFARWGPEGRNAFDGAGDGDLAGRDDKRWRTRAEGQDGAEIGHGSTGDLAGGISTRLEECKGQPGYAGTQLATAERSGAIGVVRPSSIGWGAGWAESEFRRRGFTTAVASLPDGHQFIGCPDGKFRRLPPPRVRWLGNGIPARVAKLRAFGNAIYPPLAAEVIRAYMECCPDNVRTPERRTSAAPADCAAEPVGAP